MSVWDRLALRDGKGYVWLGTQVFGVLKVHHRSSRKRLIGRITAELRRDGLVPFDHVKKIRIHNEASGPNPLEWVLSDYACFLLAVQCDALDAEMYFGSRTTEFRRTILRCQHYRNGQDCPNVGTRLEWGLVFCSEHMPLAKRVLRLPEAAA